MNQHELLLQGRYYHIFNRGINSCNLFRKADNYNYFLELYDKHISPIADTYAWVLMPNHFHLMVRIKEVEEIHNNPVHHGLTEFAMDYLWSSYLTCISLQPTNLQRERVMGWFDNQANFKLMHSQKPGYFGDNDLFPPFSSPFPYRLPASTLALAT